MKSQLVCAVLAAVAHGANLEKSRSQWMADQTQGYAASSYPNVIGPPEPEVLANGPTKQLHVEES
jgi:hypothetical protein